MTSATLKIAYQEDESAPRLELGTLAVDNAHMVKASPAQPEFAQPLSEIENEINRMTYFHMDAPPPEPVEEFESWSKVVERGDADFVPALKEVLARNYGLIVEDA